MEMVNLRRTEAERRRDETLLGGAVRSNEDGNGNDSELAGYPWGLRLELESPELQKLDLGAPEVGARLKIAGVARVVGVREDEDGRQVSLLVTDLGVATGGEAQADRESVMYPAKEG